jgi:hypothetical protein
VVVKPGSRDRATDARDVIEGLTHTPEEIRDSYRGSNRARSWEHNRRPVSGASVVMSGIAGLERRVGGLDDPAGSSAPPASMPAAATSCGNIRRYLAVAKIVTARYRATR